MRCAGTTKAGKPCGAYAMGGKTLCAGHAGIIGGPNGGGRPRVIKLPQEIRNRIREQADEIVDVLFRGLDADKPGYTDSNGVYQEGGPDWASRIRAANTLLDRGYGRSPQAVEVTGADGGPITIAELARRAREADAEEE